MAGRPDLAKRLAACIGMLVITAILTEALAAGTPVNGDDSVAAVTAGINLSTSAEAHLEPQLVSVPADTVGIASREAQRLLLLIVVAGFLAVLARWHPRTATAWAANALSWRAPPALA